ncbi:hypothetical protein PoB_004135200 [Plakobranchus ocellatus]|uniref:Uncharacterized protein n=1 Tax=Plakobranchus ocellatus TaxID=259542 RepID=A0AAV4B6N4_9GAST|nr:hypothetical protein PoB_004135200 [Plakobranchus ocellatus]
MRMRIFVTQLLNRDAFLDFNNWKTADVSASEVCTFLATVAEVVQQENKADILTIFDLEKISIVKDGPYMGLWQLFAFSYFTNCDVVSLYPELGWENVRRHCHRRISPPRPNSNKNGPVFYILWSSNREDMPGEHWTSNHFVSLLPVGCAKPVELAPCDAEVSFEPKIGSLYHIEWNGSIYVALVREIDQLERMVMVSFMAQRNALYYWPAKEDVSWEPMSSFQTEVHLALIESASSHRLQFYSVNL